MNPVIIAAVIIVNLALIFYSIGIISEQRKHKVSKMILGVLTAGVIFDISATVSSSPRVRRRVACRVRPSWRVFTCCAAWMTHWRSGRSSRRVRAWWWWVPASSGPRLRRRVVREGST